MSLGGSIIIGEVVLVLMMITIGVCLVDKAGGLSITMDMDMTSIIGKKVVGDVEVDLDNEMNMDMNIYFFFGVFLSVFEACFRGLYFLSFLSFFISPCVFHNSAWRFPATKIPLLYGDL
jgi:hypothetical protein